MSEQPEQAKAPELRASDADRERIAQILHQALGEGRLTTDELDQRLATLYATKTLRELEPLTADLPGYHAANVPTMAPQPAVSHHRIGGTPTGSSSIAVLSGAERRGRWVMPGRYTAVAIMGGVDLDLTEARFAEPDPVINVVAIMGGVDIIVPEDVNVRVDGGALMGAFESRVGNEAPEGSPTVRITGFALMGGVDVKRPKRKRPKG